MARIELIYDRDCPNVSMARAQLRQALRKMNLPMQWQEWDRNDPSAPEHVRQYGSPTIRVNGKDVAGLEEQRSNCCRVYPSDQGLQRVPPIHVIVAALGNRLGPTA